MPELKNLTNFDRIPLTKNLLTKTNINKQITTSKY